MFTFTPPRERTSVRGFTIVELLIVIVIIAILAAVTAMAYNGVQKRATNDAMVSSVNGSLKLLSMYYQDNGRWPAEAPPGTQALEYCLGQNYPANAPGAGAYESSSIIIPRQWCTDWDGSVRAESGWLTSAVAPYGTLPRATGLSNSMYSPIYGVTYPGFVLRWRDIAGLRYPVVNGSTQNGSSRYITYSLWGDIPDCGGITNSQRVTYDGTMSKCLIMLEFFGS